MTRPRSAAGSTRTARRLASACLVSCLAAAATGAEEAPLPDRSAPATAQALVVEARGEVLAGHLEAARDLLDRATRLAPDDQSVLAERDRVLGILAGTPRDLPPAPPAVLRQWALAELALARNRAENLAGIGRRDAAADQIDLALRALRTRQLDQDPSVGQAVAEARARADELRRQQTADETTQAATAATAGQTRARTDADAGESHHLGLVDERLARIGDLRRRGHLELAIDECRRLRALVPDDPRPATLQQDLLDELHQRKAASTEDQRRDLREEVQQQVREALLPVGVDGMPVYPVDWQDRLARRSAVTATTTGEDDALTEALAVRVDGTFTDAEPAEVLRSLCERAKVNLILAPELSATPKPISLRVVGLRLDNAIAWACRLIGTSWRIDHGTIYVGPAEADANVVRLYDISAVLQTPPDQPGLANAVGGIQAGAGTQAGGGQGAGANGQGGGGLGGGGQGGLGGLGGGGQGGLGQGQAQASPAADAATLISLLQSTVSPSAWEQPGTGIAPRGNLLVVSAPKAVQAQVAEFLRLQEASSNRLVRVDTRWLTLSDSLMEESGVDWESQGNPVLRASVPQLTSGAQRDTPGSMIAGTANSTSALPGYGSSASPSAGLRVGVSFLGVWQVSAILHALESDGRGRVLLATGVTTISGVSASVFNGNQNSYISGYTSDTSGNLTPQVATVPTGSALDVRPTITADGRYVMLDLQPAFSTVTFTTEIVQAPRVIAGNVATNATTGNLVLTSYPLTLPTTSVRRATTSVEVPDGGSLLLGGFDTATDKQAAARIPFLGSIPFLGRLFGTRGSFSQRDRLYLLTQVKIIRYDDQEANL